MLSNGGLGSTETAADFPLRLIESGPVAGAIVGRQIAQALGLPEVLSFDMGGTTAKACLIRDRGGADHRRARGGALPAIHAARAAFRWPCRRST